MDYSLLDYDSGCCLYCSNSHNGCLCFDCKCSKCECYIPPEDNDGEKGKCVKVGELKENSKSRFIRELKERQHEEYLQFLKLEVINKKVLELIKLEKKIAYWYSCQKCSNLFVTDEENIIKKGAEPLCSICKIGRKN